MSLFTGVKTKLAKVVAAGVYSTWLQSPAGKKFSRWIPLTGTAVFVVIATLKAMGYAGAENAVEWLYALGIRPEISYPEITASLAGLFGLANKSASMYLKAQGEIVPPNSPPVLQNEVQFDDFHDRYNALRNAGVPFNQARELALAGVIAQHAPVAAPARAELKAEVRAEQIQAVAEADVKKHEDPKK